MYIYCLLIPIARFIFPQKNLAFCYKHHIFKNSIIQTQPKFKKWAFDYLLTIFHLADELTHKLPDFLFGNLLYTTYIVLCLGERENRSFFFCQVTKSEKHAWNTIRIVWFSNTSNSRCKVTRNFLKILHPDRLESYATIGMISILQREGTTKTYQLLDEHYGVDDLLRFVPTLFFALIIWGESSSFLLASVWRLY